MNDAGPDPTEVGQASASPEGSRLRHREPSVIGRTRLWVIVVLAAGLVLSSTALLMERNHHTTIRCDNGGGLELPITIPGGEILHQDPKKQCAWVDHRGQVYLQQPPRPGS